MHYGNGKYVTEKWELTDCTIGRGGWRNFDSPNGECSFTIFLPKQLYEAMEEEGWYVRHKEQYEGRDYEYTIEVTFSFDKYPPDITMVTSDGATVMITKDNVNLLQTADIENASVIIRPYNWKNEKKGDSGVSAKLDQMTVWLAKPRRSMSASLRSIDDEED